MTALREKVARALCHAEGGCSESCIDGCSATPDALTRYGELDLADAAIRAVLEYYAENGAPLAVVKAAVDVRWADNIYDETQAVAVAQKDFQTISRAALAYMGEKK